MSKVIDERVVAMKFDNSNFEKNVKTTIASVDKLKSSLNFSGAEKGLENISKAAGNVKLDSVAQSVESVKKQFSLLDIVGVTALVNLANTAVNSGKKIFKALTIAPITDGFGEYETKINSIQTIMANVSSKGKTMEDVVKVLDKLNVYADKTIYNFSEMTRNIGTFTAAGVDLEKSADAIQGIANLAASSGSTSQQASTAMYQLSQALAAGTLKLQDWNSVVNAGMGGTKFQEALKATAREHGIAVDQMIEDQGSFRESLQEGWITAEVLTDTLKKFTVEGAEEYSQAMLKSGKYTKEQAEALKKEAQVMEDAATKVKTFTQLMDTLKEAAGSGWARTWEIILGDFEEAKNFFTIISDTVGGIINKFSDMRNNYLEGALSSKWSTFTDELEKAGVATDDFQKSLAEVAKTHGIALDQLIEKEGSLKLVIDKGLISKEILLETLKEMAGLNGETGKSTEDLTKKLEYFKKVVHDVWMGDYKNGKERIEALTKAGYEYNEVQELVNRTVHARELTLEDLTDAQLKSVGYTNEEIEAIRKLAEEAEKAGTPLNKLIEQLGRPTGRELLFQSFANLLQPIQKTLGAIGKAFSEIFGYMGDSDILYNLIAGFNELTKAFRISDKDAENLYRTFKGLFALIDLVVSTVMGGFNIAFKIASTVVGVFWKALGFANSNILDFTAIIGDGLVAIRDFIKSQTVLNAVIEHGVPLLTKICESIVNFMVSIYKLDAVQSGIKGLGTVFNDLYNIIAKYFSGGAKVIIEFIDRLKELDGFTLENFYKALEDFRENVLGYFFDFGSLYKNFEDFGKNIIDGLINGVVSGYERVKSGMAKLADILLTTVRTLLGIHSPSVEFYKIGGFAIDGLVNGIQNGIASVGAILKTLVDTMLGVVGSIDLGALFVIGTAASSIYFLKKATDILENFSKPFVSVGKVLDSTSAAISKFGGIFSSISGYINQRSKNLKADYFYTLAKAITMLAGAIVVMSMMDPLKLWNSVAVVAALSGVLAGLSVAINKIGGTNSIEVGKVSVLVLGISAAVLLMASAVKKMSSLGIEGSISALIGLTGIVGAFVALFWAFGKFDKFVKANKGDSMSKAATMMIKLSVAIGIMAGVVKLCGYLSLGDIAKGIVVVGAFMTLAGSLMVASMFAGKNASKAGTMFLKMSVAIGILALTMKTLGTLSLGDISKGLYVISTISAIFAGIMALSTIAGGSKVAGDMFLKMGLAIGILAVAMKLMGSMTIGEVTKGLVVITVISALFTKFIALSTFAGKNASAAGTMLLKMSVAMGILALTMHLISSLSLGDVAKGLAVIYALSGFFGALVFVSKMSGEHAGKAGGMLMKAAVGIGVIAVAMRVIAGMSVGDIAKGIVAVGALMGMMTLMVNFTKVNSGDIDKAGTLLIKMGATIGLLVLYIAILSLIDTSKLAVATTAIVAVMGMLTLLVASVSTLSDTKGITGPLISLGLIIGILAGVMWLLAGMPYKQTIAAGAALSAVMLSMAATLKIISNVSSVSKGALVGMAALTGIMVLIGSILTIMGMCNPQSAIPNAIALSTLLLAMSAALTIMSTVKDISADVYLGMATLSAIMVLLGTILTIMSLMNVQNAIPNAIALSTLLLAMSAALAVMSTIKNISADVYLGMTALSAIMVLLGTILWGMSALGVQNAIPNAIAIGTLMLSMSATLAILTVIGTASTAAYPAMLALGVLIGGLGAVIWGLGELCNNVVGLEGTLDKGIMILGKIGEGLGSFLGGIVEGFINQVLDTLPNFGLKLSQFMVNLTPFLMGLKLVDESSTNAAKSLGAAILAITAANVINGIASFLGLGDNSFEKLGAQLVPFGEAMVSFSDTVKGKVDDKAVEAAANAGKMMAELQNSIAPSGGVWQDIFGEKNLGDFADQMEAFGKGLVAFCGTLAETTIDSDKVEAAKNAGMMMSELQKSIAPQGGVWQNVFGSQDLGDFAGQMEEYGKGVAAFSDAVSGENSIDSNAVEAAKNAGMMMAELSKAVQDADGRMIKWGDDNSLTKFSGQLGEFGEDIATYSTNVAGVDSAKIAATSTAIAVLVGVAKNVSEIDDNYASGFVSTINTLATTNVSGFINAFKGKTTDLVAVGVGMINAIKNGALQTKQSLLNAFASISKSTLAKIKESNPDFKKSGTAFVNEMKKGISENKSKPSDACKTMLESCIKKIEGYYNDFYDAGSYLVAGFALGISKNTYSAVAKAKVMAAQADEAARKELGIRSPSRAFIEIGRWVPAGMAIGIEKASRMVTGAVSDMSYDALHTSRGMMSLIHDVINMDIDTQPTIAPVLDLSDIKSGVRTIDNMFGGTQAIKLAARMSNINTTAKTQFQNRNYNDVISAIEDLRDSLNSTTGDTYNVNGITYQEGSNVGETIKALVKAAIMEGRR